MARNGLISLLSVAAVASALCGRAVAAIEAYANINISNFQLWQDTGMGQAPLNNGFPINVVDNSTVSSARANIASIPGGPIQTDTPQAFEGVGAAPAENTFINTAGAIPFARGDTNAGGSMVGGLPVPAPAFASAVAEVALSTNSVTDVGSAQSSISSTLNFSVTPILSFNLVIIFDASRSMFAELIPSPPASTAVADSSFAITITNGGTPVFQWSPDGQLGTGIVGGTELSDPFDINGGISAAPGTSSSLDNATGNFSARFMLLQGLTYSFRMELSTAADASADAFDPLPLPGDFDVDLDVDLVDYLTLSTHLHTDVSGLTPEQSYFLGDMTRDRRIDGNDFRGFRFAYDAANGAGAFVAMLAGVPEPSSGLLAALACVPFLRQRRGRRRSAWWCTRGC